MAAFIKKKKTSANQIPPAESTVSETPKEQSGVQSYALVVPEIRTVNLDNVKIS
ncbi:MAG: hypothetical protein MR487_09050 [Lachnospiraceae bacterium]|nr:hypothetical protein [Lachnospiraceae bacterium]